MSISALDGSSLSTGFGLGQMQGASGGEKPSAEDMAEFIVSQDDADGDGLLSLGETPLDEERFSSIDADGDGYLTAEELAADAQSREQEMNTLAGQISMQMQGIDPSEMAASIIENDDTDGDGLLSFEETPLDEEKFNSIDTDGDGYISAEELSTDMEEMMAEGVPAPPAGGMEQQAAAASGSDESSESDEEYDELDLNEDGVVSMDELLQAYQNGDESLSNMFAEITSGTMMQRYAMEAYQQQMA